MTDRPAFLLSIDAAYQLATVHRGLWSWWSSAATDTFRLFSTMLVFADWLEEQGEPDLAFAYRWAARRQRFPEPTFARRYWQWSARLRGQHRPVYAHQLPPIIFNNMPGKFIVQTSPGYVSAKSVESAFAHLSRALAKIRKEIE